MSVSFFLILGSMLFAVAFGFSVAKTIASIHRESVYKKTVMARSNESGLPGKQRPYSGIKGVESGVIDLVMRMETRSPKPRFSKNKKNSKNVEEKIRLAGLYGQVSERSIRETSTFLLFIGASLGFVAGFVFSVELAFMLALVGAVLGGYMPKRVLKNRINRRSADAERHLPEMLDVMALCMRSGLSIDASIAIYSRHFDTMLAHELECARRKWSSGLERREESLRKLASTYDSVILSRVVDTIVRSARYGSSMISSLESDSREARSAYRATREEKIAKAPVKMMVPTGVLILPAMLIMVLGPVLLELMEGGF